METLSHRNRSESPAALSESVLRLARDGRPTGRCWTEPLLPRAAIEASRWAAVRVEADDTVAHLVPTPGAVRTDPGLPDVREWAALLAVGVVQVLDGRRPVAQLARHLDSASLTQLGAAAAHRRRRTHPRPSGRAVDLARVRSVHVQCVSPRVAEVAVHVATAAGSSAMALRLEGVGDRWSCTALALDAMRQGPEAA